MSPGRPKVSNSVKRKEKNVTWTLRSSFERHEIRVGWRGHSDQKRSDAFQGGWEPDEAGGRLVHNFICDGCLQGSAAYGTNLSSNRREYNGFRIACTTNLAVSVRSEISRKAGPSGPDSGLVQQRTWLP